MPTYNYQCQKCNYIFEKFLPMKDNGLPETMPCEQCNELCIKQIIMGQPLLIDPFNLGRMKPPDNWRSFIKKLKKAHPDSKTINIE